MHMVNTPSDTPTSPDGQPKRLAWRLTKKKLIWPIAVLVAVALAVGAFVWYQGNRTDESAGNEDESRQDDTLLVMSLEERYRFENIKRADGVIEKVDGDDVMVEQSNDKTTVFHLTNDTQYIHGDQGGAGDKQSVSSGKKVSISYDQNNNYIQSIWVDYDVASN